MSFTTPPSPLPSAPAENEKWSQRMDSSDNLHPSSSDVPPSTCASSPCCPSPGPSVQSDSLATPRLDPVALFAPDSARRNPSDPGSSADGDSVSVLRSLSSIQGDLVRAGVTAPAASKPAFQTRFRTVFQRIENWRRRGIIIQDLTTLPLPVAQEPRAGSCAGDLGSAASSSSIHVSISESELPPSASACLPDCSLSSGDCGPDCEGLPAPKAKPIAVSASAPDIHSAPEHPIRGRGVSCGPQSSVLSCGAGGPDCESPLLKDKPLPTPSSAPDIHSAPESAIRARARVQRINTNTAPREQSNSAPPTPSNGSHHHAPAPTWTRSPNIMSPSRMRAFINSCATEDEQAGRVPISQQTKQRQKAMFQQVEAWRRGGVSLDDIPDPPPFRI